MNLFRLLSKAITLHSGQKTRYKINCNALTNADWKCLAFIAATEMLPPFSAVEGVPTGGLKFAKALQKYCQKTGPLLIVDDVCTTGNSMNEHLGDRKARGCVVFCRGVCPPWVIPLFRMPEGYASQIAAAPFRGKQS